MVINYRYGNCPVFSQLQQEFVSRRHIYGKMFKMAITWVKG
jgi:hypothetical protein